MRKLIRAQLPRWTGWVVFIVFTCLFLLWFSGYFEGAYDKHLGLTDYANQILAK